MRNLVSNTVTLFPTVLSSSTSQSPEKLAAPSSSLDFIGTGKPVASDSNENTASSSQVMQPGVNPSSSTGTPVAKSTKSSVGARLFVPNLKISQNNVDHLEKVHSNVRRKLGRPPNDDMGQIDVNVIICGLFMFATMKAAVHLGHPSLFMLDGCKRANC